MSYAFKKFIGALGAPMSMALVLCAIALVLRLRGRRRAAAWLVSVAAALIYLCSVAPVSDLLIGPLESRYGALRDPRALAPKFVVVLGSGYAPRDGLPPTSTIDSEGLTRIVEGVRLLRPLPDARLVVSGGAPGGRPAPARGYLLLATELGVDPARIVVLDLPLDTSAESRHIATVVGTQPFLLVTSAFHMPRAINLMQRRGLHAIPAPTAHRVNRAEGYGWSSLVPGAGPLRSSEIALHEYLGLAALAFGIDE